MSGNYLVGIVLIRGRIARVFRCTQGYGYSRCTCIRYEDPSNMFVTTFKLITSMILNTRCVKKKTIKKMYNTLNRQILRRGASILVNVTCFLMHIFYDEPYCHILSAVLFVLKSQYNTYCVKYHEKRQTQSAFVRNLNSIAKK